MSIFPYVQQQKYPMYISLPPGHRGRFLSTKKIQGTRESGTCSMFPHEWTEMIIRMVQTAAGSGIPRTDINCTKISKNYNYNCGIVHHLRSPQGTLEFGGFISRFWKIKGLGFRLCKEWNSQRWHCILLRLETLGAQPLVLPLISWQEPQENYLLSLEFHDIYKVYVSLRDIWGTKRHDMAQYLHFTFLKLPSRTQKWCQWPIKWDRQVSPSCWNYSCSCNKNTWSHKINQEIFVCYDAPSAPGPYTSPTNTKIQEVL